MTAIAQLAIGIIGILVGIMLLTSLGPTIVDQTDTAATTPLENASATAKTAYSLIELGWPLLGVIFLFGGGFALVSGFKKM